VIYWQISKKKAVILEVCLPAAKANSAVYLLDSQGVNALQFTTSQQTVHNSYPFRSGMAANKHIFFAS
jgi:hypothetical protein